MPQNTGAPKENLDVIVAAILASGGLNTTGHDHTAKAMVSRFKEVLEELQQSKALAPHR